MKVKTLNLYTFQLSELQFLKTTLIATPEAILTLLT
jgi:hypothetical protein